MNKPTKPSETLPSSFGGIKENFSSSKITNGYEPDVPDILGGANLNYLLDTLGKRDKYYESISDFINNIPIAKTITVDNNNNLVYKDWLGGRNFGELVYSAIPLSDSGLKLLDGSLIQGTGIYANFVTYIASIYSTYPSIFVSEATWQSNVSTYGVCGKFVYDSVNNTVRLPKITGIVEGTVDVNALGDVVQSGLPQHTHSGTTNEEGWNHTHTRGNMNIQGWIGLSGIDPQTYTGNAGGAFTKTNWDGWGNGHGGHIPSGGVNFEFNANRNWGGTTSTASANHAHTFTSNNANNTIYKTSVNTVQPQTVKCFIYMVVATGVTKTNIEIDIDDVISDLNYKADIDLSNATQNISESAKKYFTELSFPSDRYIDLPLGTSGTSYTAVSDGYVWFQARNNITDGQISINSSSGLTISNRSYGQYTNSIFLPIKKDDNFYIYYDGDLIGTENSLKFFYATGAESEE